MTRAVVKTKLQWFTELRGADLTHAEFRVLTVLATYTDASMGNAFPGLGRLAADSKVTENTAKRALKSLQSKGWARLTQHGGNQYGKGRANVWSVASPSFKGVTQCPPSGTDKGVTDEPPSSRDNRTDEGGHSTNEGGHSTTSEGGHSVPPHQVITTSGHKEHQVFSSSHLSNARESRAEVEPNSEENPLGWLEWKLPTGYLLGERATAERMFTEGISASAAYYRIVGDRHAPKSKFTRTRSAS